jgi:hypothetical protein
MIRSGVVGPKPRPSGVGDGEQVHIPAPACDRLQWTGGRDREAQPAQWTWPVAARSVGGAKTRPKREGRPQDGLRPAPSEGVPLSPRKAPPRGRMLSVPQTDAGGLGEHSQGARVILCQGTRQINPVTSGEGGPQYPGGRRAPRGSGWHEIGPSDCLPKTQVPANTRSGRIGADACPVLEG